jgi:GntR family negative regulator for fad regulon and positive regulator of fabA
MAWEPPQKPAEATETRLIAAMLDGSFAIGSNLPPERTLAAQLGVTRPTLREALQRLARDGWVEIRHGLPTRVRDFWREGSLGVLGAISRRQENLPPDFIPNLLEVRLTLAPGYARLAILHNPVDIVALLSGYGVLADDPQAYTQADWDLHHALTVGSGNPVYTLILNGFHDLHFAMGPTYFALPTARAHSRAFYESLLGAADMEDADAAEALTQRVMTESLDLWRTAAEPAAGGTP